MALNRTGADSVPLRYAHFDPHRRCRSPELAQRVTLFVNMLEAAELQAGHRATPRGPVGRRKFAVAVKALVCNLLVLRALDPERLLLVPLSHGAMYSPRRFRSEVFGEHFIDAVRILTAPALGYCEVVSGGFKLPSGVGRQTAIRALPAFLEHFGAAALSVFLRPVGQSRRGHHEGAGTGGRHKAGARLQGNGADEEPAERDGQAEC